MSKHNSRTFRSFVDLKLGRICSLWLILVAGGFHTLLIYGATPGEAGEPPTYWPAQSDLSTQPRLYTIVMTIHPHCGCSRASLGELAIIMGRFQDKVNADVLFYAPSNFDPHWMETDLWETAQSIPGVHAIVDRDGDTAKLFGVKTSGQTLLYDTSGELIFSGGITSSRGHSGDNAGRDAITTLLLHGHKPNLQKTFVFGCHLLQPQRLSEGDENGRT